MKNTKETFHWIVNILNKHNIPFIITGGLAAKSYGSPRIINDIDIDIPDKNLETILEDVRPYVTFGPDRGKDERWDLLIMKLNHNGQEMDISGGDTLKICDARTGKWQESPTDFSNFEMRKIFGLTVPVIARKDLVDYKSMLVGDHQKIDIEAVINAK